MRGDQALADFRQDLTPEWAIEELKLACGRLLIQLPVGVGKTRLLLATILLVTSGVTDFDLVVVLIPRWDILNEIVQELPPGLDHVVLRPRPTERCGDLDVQWQQYERVGCGLLGREEICRLCPNRGECDWPDQYSDLAGVNLIFATQHHLELDPFFPSRLQTLSKAQQPLLLLDESDLFLKSGERIITQNDLDSFFSVVLNSVPVGSSAHTQWTTLNQSLRIAPTDDLQKGNWHVPYLPPKQALAVQQAGRTLHGLAFRYLGFELCRFARSDPPSRERLPNSDLRFTTLPHLGQNFIVLSGTISPGLVRYRIDPEHRHSPIHSPFEGLQFQHPETRWFNLSSMAGAANNFPGNATRILDFFAAKIAQNIVGQKRTLLISRKKFFPVCIDRLTARLNSTGAGPVRIVTNNWEREDLSDPRTLPLINYGVSGVNLFEEFDAAYCLTGYYVSPSTLSQVVHDLDLITDRFPISIETSGSPPRRISRIDLPDDRGTIVPDVVQWVLDQKEADVVVQAVGRVRPFTRPREVVTFHAGEIPGVTFDLAFDSLSQARAFFGIRSRRVMDRDLRAEQARMLRSRGLTLEEIMTRIGISRSSVQRYLRSTEGHET